MYLVAVEPPKMVSDPAVDGGIAAGQKMSDDTVASAGDGGIAAGQRTADDTVVGSKSTAAETVVSAAENRSSTAASTEGAASGPELISADAVLDGAAEDTGSSVAWVNKGVDDLVGVDTADVATLERDTDGCEDDLTAALVVTAEALNPDPMVGEVAGADR